MSLDIKGLIKTGIGILTTTLTDTGRIVAQLGHIEGETADSDNADWWQHVSFVSRPSKPKADGTGGPQAITIDRGGRDAVIASQDQRGLDLFGNLNFGEFCVYAPGEDGTGQARLLGKSNGSLILMTSNDNTSAGAAVALKLSPTELRFEAPWGNFVFDASGFHLKTKAGPRLDMGGITIPGLAPQALADALAGYAQLTAPVVKLKASNVMSGVGPVYFPVTYNTNLTTADSTVAHAALVAALTAFVNGIGPAVATVTNGTGAAGTIGALATTLSTALATLPPPKPSNAVWSSP